MQAKQMPEKTFEFTIPETAEIFYPEDERVELAKCLELNGFLKLCIDTTGVQANTIKKYATPGSKGQKDKVRAVASFVKAYNQKSAA